MTTDTVDVENDTNSDTLKRYSMSDANILKSNPEMYDSSEDLKRCSLDSRDECGNIESSLRTIDAEVANCTKTSRKLNNRNLAGKTLDERNKSLVKRSPGLARRLVNEAGQHVDAVDQVPEIEVIKENGSVIKRTENGKQTSIVVSDGNVVHDGNMMHAGAVEHAGNVMHAGTVGHAGNVMHAGTVGHAGNGINNQAKRDKIAQIDALYTKQIEAEMMHEGLTYGDASNKSDATDIKNEYDYVKYTRVQVGNDTNIKVNSLAESGDHKMLDHITDDQCELEQNFLTEELQKVSKKESIIRFC